MVTFSDHTPIFERSVVRCGSKNGQQKGIMCLEESGLCAKCLLIVLGSIAMIGENRPLVTDETVEFEK